MSGKPGTRITVASVRQCCPSTQALIYEKAQLSFAEQLPVNDEAFEWQLKQQQVTGA